MALTFATRTLGFVSLFFLYLSSTANTFEVMNTRSPLVTRTGCKVVLTCGGFGRSIEWRKFGELSPLETNENQSTSFTTITTDNMSVPYLIANATIIASPSIDNERFLCFIFGSPPGRTISHIVQLRVAASVVDIFPEIPDVNISTYHTDADVTIGCPVQTCAEEVTVQFLRGDQVVKSSEESLTGEHSVFNLVLTVSDSITGLYACKVDTTNPDASTLKQFDVLGTPLPPLPTTKPPTHSSGTDRPMLGGTNGDISSDDNNNNNAAVVVTLAHSLAALLITIHLLWF